MSIGSASSLPDLNTIRQQLCSDVEGERWAGAADLGEYVFDHPEKAWPLVLEFGSSAVEDTRSAIATCVLEHILEHHFDVYFPMLALEIEKKRSGLLADTLSPCSKFGQAREYSRAMRWDSLLSRFKRDLR